MVAMEEELRMRKKGQVIQHRHISPPLPSSSQPTGIAILSSWLNSDSPSRRAVERKALLQQHDILDVEIISSPPLSTQSQLEVLTIISTETSQDSPVTPVNLGGSKFRRKPIV